jgi:hypothetical protein
MKERDTWVELHGRRHAALGHERAACPAILANFLRDMVLYPDHDTLGWALAHYGTDEWLIENREKGWRLVKDIYYSAGAHEAAERGAPWRQCDVANSRFWPVPGT